MNTRKGNLNQITEFTLVEAQAILADCEASAVGMRTLASTIRTTAETIETAATTLEDVHRGLRLSVRQLTEFHAGIERQAPHAVA